MSAAQLQTPIAPHTAQLAGRPLDAALQAWLNAQQGVGSATALFDGRPAGWLVCPPGSAHAPTVSQGRALALFLLPQGQIPFTR